MIFEKHHPDAESDQDNEHRGKQNLKKQSGRWETARGNGRRNTRDEQHVEDISPNHIAD
jgi:hypothetical protein